MDIGGNVGAFKRLFPESKYYVLDYPDEVLKKAKENGCITIKHDLNMLPLRFRDNSFDMVICMEVFEHIFYPSTMLKEIKRILKPKGIAILSFPNEFHLTTRLRILFDIWQEGNEQFGDRALKDYCGQHVNIFSVKGVKKSVSSLFQVADIKYAFLMNRLLRYVPLKGFLLKLSPNLFASNVVIKAIKSG